MNGPTLRPYQLAATEAVQAAVVGAGLNRLLVKAPTGTGKTVWFASLVQALGDWVTAQPGKSPLMLVIAHHEELLDQALEKIQRANPGLMCSVEQGERHANSYSDVVIASIQTLAARDFTRLRRLLRRGIPRIVIVDEAHHAAAATYRTALAHLGFLPTAVSAKTGNIEAATHDDVKVMQRALEGWDRESPKDRLLIGVTATPNRSDAIGLACVFQTLAHSYGLKQAVDDGWLVPIKPWVIETADNLDGVKTTAGDFNQKQLAEAVNNPRRNRLAVDAWKLYASDRQSLTFTVDVAHAHDMAEEYRRGGIKALALSGETPKDDRRIMLRQLREGTLQQITNCMVLTEGTDLPMVSCIVHAKPTKSATLYEQMTGRGLRLHPGKVDCLVLDVVDVARRHSLQTAPILYGLPPGVKTKGEDLRQIEADLDKLREKMAVDDILDGTKGRFSLQELLDRASTFDVWTVAQMGTVGEGLTLNWVLVGPDHFRLSYPWQDGTEVLAVSRDLLGHFDVSCTLRPREGNARQRTLATEVITAQAALSIAESFVHQERRAAARLRDRDAHWRSNKPSAKQLGALRAMGVTEVPGTMGRASDLISMAKARRGR